MKKILEAFIMLFSPLYCHLFSLRCKHFRFLF